MRLDPFATTPIGSTDVHVTLLGLGGAAAYASVKEEVSGNATSAVVSKAYESGIRYFDTAPQYGYGSSELQLGASLNQRPRDSYVISTKVGRIIEVAQAPKTPQGVLASPPARSAVFDFSRQGVARSFRESLERLQTDFIDICLVHDPDHAATVILDDPNHEAHFKEVMDDTWPALAELRERGLVRALGVGMNQWPMLYDFVQTGKFDCILLAGRYTLLDQSSLDKLLPACLENNVSVIVGGPYNSGILASGPIAGATYNYSPASPQILNRVRQLATVCQDFRVELKAAALQFPLAHPAVAAVIPGARSASEVTENVRLLTVAIPSEFWTELRRRKLIEPGCPIPN